MPKFIHTLRQVPVWLFVLTFAIYYALFFCQVTILTASDLGRHIMNGKVILETGTVFSTNRYSYTFPDRFAPNHHWLFGVITYEVERIGGFSSLTILSASLYAAGVAVILFVAAKKYGKLAALIAGLLAVPPIISRNEVRPEAFSLFFFALQWAVLWLWSEKKLSSWLVALTLATTTILWVNIHIFFIFSFLLPGVFGMQALLSKSFKQFWQLVVLGCIEVLAVLCNPLGLQGTLYPFHILGEYGYRVAENQTTFFFLQYHPSFIYYFLVIVSLVGILTVATFIGRHVYKKTPHLISTTLLFVTFLILSNKMVRFQNFFGLTLIFFAAFVVQQVRLRWWQKFLALQHNVGVLALTSLVGFSICMILLASGSYLPFNAGFGLGLPAGMQASGEFMKNLHLSGAIFNDFDIGSYAIYHLYPAQKVLVDNRAEAYPSSFLQTYLRSLQDAAAWKKLDDQYHFQTIFFYRYDSADGAQEFLVRLVENNNWVPIYVDNYAIIFIRNSPENQAIIQKYQLPQEMFSVTKK